MQYDESQHAADLKREPSRTGDAAAPSYAVATQAGVRKAEGGSSAWKATVEADALAMQRYEIARSGARSRCYSSSSVSLLVIRLLSCAHDQIR